MSSCGFFPCLLLTSSLYYLLRKRQPLQHATVILLVIGVCGLFSLNRLPQRLPWGLDTALVASSFYALGSALRTFLQRPSVLGWLLSPWMLLPWLTLLFGLSLANGRVDLQALSWGIHPGLYIPGALAGIGAVLTLARMLPATPVTRWLSANTLFIFPLHPLFFSIFTGIGMLVFHLPESFKQSSAGISVLYVVGALALCWPASLVCRKLFPAVFSRKTERLPVSIHPPAGLNNTAALPSPKV